MLIHPPQEVRCPHSSRRLAALAAVVALGFIAPVPAQAHRGNNHDIATHLAIAKEPVGEDGVGTVSGRLSARRVPLADRAVYLLVKHGDWVRGSAQSAPTGTVGQLRRQPRGADDVPPAVRRRRGRAGAQRGGAARTAHDRRGHRVRAPSVVDPGGTATVSAVVTDDNVPLAEAAVELRGRTRNTDGYTSWPPAPPRPTAAWRSTCTPERTTRYVVRLGRTEERRGASSNPVVVAVRAATHLSIRKDTFGEVIAVAAC